MTSVASLVSEDSLVDGVKKLGLGKPYTEGLEMHETALLFNITVPPGAVRMYRNLMQYAWVQITEDPNDPQLNQPVSVAMPTDNSKKDAKYKDCVCFSHLTGKLEEFKEAGNTFEPMPNANTLIDGVLFDNRIKKELVGYDYHIDLHDDGNLLAIFLVPLGYTKHFHKNEVCNRCGKFPSYLRCFDCNSGSFCSDYCLREARVEDTHSAIVCTKFIEEKVKRANPILVRKDKK